MATRKKASARQRLSYWFDNMMSKGTLSLLLVLGTVTLVVVIIGGLLAVMLGGADGEGGGTVGGSVWFTLMHALNTGVLAKEEGTIPYLLVMTIVTLVGIFITSFLIGTISNGIKDKVTSLQRGHSLVLERNHVVIIGFDENVTSIVAELALANENQKNPVVVIMADHDKTDMEEVIRERVPDLYNLRVICRSGHPDSVKDLKVCSLDTCRSIIINLVDDFMTVKTMLACESLLDEYGNTDAYITATVRDREVLQPAKIAGGDRAEVLNFQKTISRLMVQTSRNPGMSEVLTELLSFKGNEIYVLDVPEVRGKSFSEINLRMPTATAIGVVRDGTPLLNPDADSLVLEGDQLIVISLDDDHPEIRDAATIDDSAFARGDDADLEPQTLLVFGCTDMLAQIIREVDGSSAPGSRIIVAAEPGQIDTDLLPDQGQLTNVEIDVRATKIFARRVLEGLVAEQPTSIMLLSDPTIDAEEADARTLMLQLQLTDIAEGIGVDIPLTIEMNSTRNQRLSQMMRATDFVVSSRVTAKMMAQIAEERHKKDILNDLLSEGGSTVDMKPITHYVRTDVAVDFYTLGASAARYGEIAIGYKKFADDGTFTIEVNPRSKAATKFSDADSLIVIAHE